MATNNTITVLLVLLLAGCGQSIDGTNHGYGFHFDGETALGLRYRFEEGTKPESHLTPEQFDRAYQETADCLGVSIPPIGPLVVIVRFDQLPNLNGFAYLDTGLILVQDDSIVFEYILTAGFVANSALKHELIHFLLRRGDHPSPPFGVCDLSNPTV